MGVFGARVKMATTTILHPGDRVELYRPLIVDPKESRRSRAEFQKRGRVQK
ncbi:RnfH family protein [Litorivicinus sp.]|nr:RnfH family protein [Litorivicinus sp.]